jgi:hypothetical protein
MCDRFRCVQQLASSAAAAMGLATAAGVLAGWQKHTALSRQMLQGCSLTSWLLAGQAPGEVCSDLPCHWC